jgi:hypothetical protein
MHFQGRRWKRNSCQMRFCGSLPGLNDDAGVRRSFVRYPSAVSCQMCKNILSHPDQDRERSAAEGRLLEIFKLSKSLSKLFR